MRPAGLSVHKSKLEVLPRLTRWVIVGALKLEEETPMLPIARRAFIVAVAVAPIAHVTSVHAVDALPDARFVGFAETVNDFEIQSGRLALAKSSNEIVRAYATRAVAEHTKIAESLSRNRNEAGVTMAPDEEVRKIAGDAMTRLNSLQ